MPLASYLRKIPVITLLLLLALSGCAPTPQKPEVAKPSDLLELLGSAKIALDDGAHGQAADIFGQLAERSEPPLRYEYQLAAANALYLAGDDDKLQGLLATLPIDELGPDLNLQYQLLQATLTLERDPEEALNLLRFPAAEQYQVEDISLLGEYYSMRAMALSQLGNHLESSREYIQGELFLTDPTAIETNQKKILHELSRLSGQTLEQLHILPPPDTLGGWIELSLIARDPALGQQDTEQRLARWHEAYPRHPVRPGILDKLEENKLRMHTPAENIALLLPFSGRYAKVGAAVRDGFLSAYYNSPQHEKVTLRFYDAGDNPYQSLLGYRQAVLGGADFIIGPLNKSGVEIVVQQDDIPVTTLTLNYSGELPRDNLYQMALAPEDEASQVAEKAWQEGFSEAVLLVPDSSLGIRSAESFAQRWQELGGNVVETVRYNPDSNDFSRSIKALLGIDKSELRHRQLSDLLGQLLEFSPRRRQDIDMIFLTAQPRQARLIRPQLAFHYAGTLPIYATSHLFSGEVDKEKDIDLEGILFVDMPWTLDAATPLKEARHEERDALQQHRGQLQRLVALGADAYQLAASLMWMKNYPSDYLPGESGRLRLGADNRVQRQLLLARFHKGIPQVVEAKQPESAIEQ